MSRFFRTALYLLSFGFARGTLFVAPIFLANSLSARAYGTIEWAHAAGSLAATIAAFGTASALPLVELKRTDLGSQVAIYMHHMMMALLCFIFVAGAKFFGYGIAIQMAALLSLAIALQSLWSIHLKSHGKGEASLLLDAALFSVMAVVAVSANFFQVIDGLNWIFWSLMAYVLCLTSFTGILIIGRLRAGDSLVYWETLRLGMPLMIGAMVTIAATTSGRLVIGYVGGVLLTADYAILARAAALPIVAHQVILVAKFRQLYVLPDIEMEKIILLILSLVALSVIGFWALIPYIGWMLGAVFVKVYSANTLIAILILAQTILWSGISLNDTVNTRQQTMLKVLPWSILALLLSIPVAIFLIRVVGITLLHFVYIHGLVMFLFYLVQVLAMYFAGIRLWRPWAFAVLSYSFLIALASLVYQ
ncbi:hypothetical protein BH11PSE12_BH11PSE12_00330 [soil metagenome]